MVFRRLNRIAGILGRLEKAPDLAIYDRMERRMDIHMETLRKPEGVGCKEMVRQDICHL